MDITVCITTMNKSHDDIIKLYHKIGISSNALFCNQCGKRESYSLNINNHTVIVECFDDVGVSKNRNHIIDYAYGDICINIDDDCCLVDNYLSFVELFFVEHDDVNVVQFNGVYNKEKYRLIHTKKDKIIKTFNDVSYAGAPGLVYRTSTFKRYNIRYNEKVGHPNYVYLGEDSLFLKGIIDSRVSFFRSSTVLFNVVDDIDNSSYFNGVDEQYCISKGAITKLLHPRLYWLYLFRYTIKIRHWRNCKLSYYCIFKKIRIGFKYSVELL